MAPPRPAASFPSSAPATICTSPPRFSIAPPAPSGPIARLPLRVASPRLSSPRLRMAPPLGAAPATRVRFSSVRLAPASTVNSRLASPPLRVARPPPSIVTLRPEAMVSSPVRIVNGAPPQSNAR